MNENDKKYELLLFIQYLSLKNQTSLHQILLHQPTTKVGIVILFVIVELAFVIEQAHSVPFYQSQRGAQGNSIGNPRNCRLRMILGIISITNIGTFYLKMNQQRRDQFIFNSRKLEVVNPFYRGSENPRMQIKSIAFIQERRMERDNGYGTKSEIPLDVEMDNFRLNVQISNQLLGNCNSNKYLFIYIYLCIALFYSDFSD